MGILGHDTFWDTIHIAPTSNPARAIGKIKEALVKRSV
jgi:hypothetical protein